MKKSFVIHPFLFAIFPILFLFAYNIREVPYNEIVKPVAIVVSFSFVMWLLLIFVVSDKQKAGIITTIFLLLFFSYGHLLNAAKGLAVTGIGSIVLIWEILFFIVVTYITVKTRRNLHNITNFTNIVAISLILINLINIGTYESISRANVSMEIRAKIANLREPDRRPDIYYIILDGYARADVLRELYQYDNTKFLNNLIQKGFYIANSSRANYAQTALSLTSSLNLTYLDDLANRINAESDDREPLRNMIKENTVAKFLKQHGYTLAAFSSGVYGTEISKADIYMSPKWSLSEFQNELINFTPIPILLNVLPQRTQYDLHRDRILYILDHLADMTKLNIPVFVFAHILVPHPPFVFGENGERVGSSMNFSLGDGSQIMDKDDYVESYKRQLIFINKKIESIIDEIISNSPEPPIIILQADHGPGSMLHWGKLDKIDFRERISILNAYYLPNNGRKQLYNEISPVNTFRIIFNRYFGTNLELLKDKSYFSTWKQPYKFIDVTDK